MTDQIYLDEKLTAMTSTTNSASVNRGVDTSSIFLGSSASYSGQYNAMFTRRNRFSTSSPEGCDECCLEGCCAVCALGGSVVCVTQMTRAKRVKILWVWLTLLALAGGIACAVGIFGLYSENVAPTDMRIVDRKLSPYFCDSVTLDSNTELSAYLFDKVPAIDTHDLQRYEERDTSYVLYNDFKSWKFYLLRHSKITVLSCADVSIQFYVIQGYENFTSWKRNHFCFDCTLDSMIITWDCNQATVDNLTMTVSESDDYYFVYADGVDDTWVSPHFQLQRSVYDISTATDMCLQDMECTFDLDLHKHEVVIYHVSGDYFDIGLTVNSQCNTRVWFYMLSFCACPVTLGCILSVILYKCCKDPRADRLNMIRPPRRVLSRFPNERTPLLWGETPAAVPEPPKYEDIIRDDNVAPPTYEQATS